MRNEKAPYTPGLRLRALRTTHGKTQLEVELEASLGIGYLQRLERGKVQRPERDTLERILTALGAGFTERCEILGQFGYSVPMSLSLPTEAETHWAINVFQSELKQDSIPAYLLDCRHRLLAWNPLVCNVFGVLKSLSDAVLIPKLVFDPAYGIATAVLNAEAFFSAQIRILQFERQRFGNEAWYDSFINDMRHYRTFDDYWKQYSGVDPGQIPMRPVARLELPIERRVARFRLISETFVQDPRFRVIYYMPTDPATIRQCVAWQS